MRYRCFPVVVLAVVMTLTLSASAQQQSLIVRDSRGVSDLTDICLVLGCSIERSLGDPQQQVFLVSPTLISLNSLLQLLQLQTEIIDVEIDQILGLQPIPLTFIPGGLSDTTPVHYYGVSVWDGYVNQPANLIVRTAETQSQYQVSGSGIVAIIDTGLDPHHPALAPVVLRGYDFTRNRAGADETADLDHSTAAVLDGNPGSGPIYVNSWLAAVVSPAGAAALNNSQYADFGHGTMTAGIVHMVAPTAQILPLKAFSSDGTGYLSSVVAALYYAAGQGSKVVSMSFSFASYSTELADAINYVNGQGLICVAAAGNNGEEISVYPASLGNVMGIASTSDYDTLSSFSNYGPQVVWVGAPGENIISTYPYDSYASSSGTSFSTPFVSGTASLLVNINPNMNQSSAAAAIAHAVYISPQLNNGRLDTFQAVGSIY